MSDADTKIAVKQDKPAAAPAAQDRPSPLTSLRAEIDRLFEAFDPFDWRSHFPRRPFLGGPLRSWAGEITLNPAMDLVERDGEFEIQAELPGLEPKDVEVRVSDGYLTISGEKSAEKTEEKDDYHLSERSYGSFQRSFRLPPGTDAGKIHAEVAKGVLTVRIPKSAEARDRTRKIEVKAG